MTLPPVTSALRTEFAPTGALRAGINHGNPVLANKDPATGELKGVAVDLARELGRRLELPVTLVAFTSAGAMTDALEQGAWDVAFLAAEAGRADRLGFSAPHLIIEGAYLVPEKSAFRVNADVDREGVRVAVSAKSAYDLYLSRNLKYAELVRAPGILGARELYVGGKVDVLAGVRQLLAADAVKLPGARLLDGRFMAIEQAAGMPKAREAALRYLRGFIEEMKSSGFVATALERAGVRDVMIAPAG
ncbi:MAG: transporter substrate-binding domain-containing protein [Betaproteobacteria bacterium]|nr:transporter substrate-binding domain-containing protein [Betaproteobacteria bacterium]